MLVAIKTSKGTHGYIIILFYTCSPLSPLAMFSEREKGNLLKEISKMASFEHQNVMELIGVCLDGEMPLIIMPFMMNGTVLDHVRKVKDKDFQVSINAESI